MKTKIDFLKMAEKLLNADLIDAREYTNLVIKIKSLSSDAKDERQKELLNSVDQIIKAGERIISELDKGKSSDAKDEGENKCPDCGNILNHKYNYVTNTLTCKCGRRWGKPIPTPPLSLSTEEIKQLFRNNADTYVDTWEFDTVTGLGIEGEVIQAMSEDKFVEIIARLRPVKKG